MASVKPAVSIHNLQQKLQQLEQTFVTLKTEFNEVYASAVQKTRSLRGDPEKKI